MDPERDNAEHLIEFMNSYSMIHAPSQKGLPPRKLVTYKEMTCADPTPEDPTGRPLTIFCSPPLSDSFTFHDFPANDEI